jgi:hypothetical protein
MQQAALAIHQGAQVTAHPVEIVAKISQFITPLAHTFANPYIEITGGSGIECPAQLADRLGDIPGQAGSTKQTSEQSTKKYREGRQTQAMRWRVRWSMAVTGEWRRTKLRRRASSNMRLKAITIEPEKQARPQCPG